MERKEENINTKHVTSPTRLDNFLDLVLSNDSFSIFDLDVCAPFHHTNDHNSITFKVFLALIY